MYVVPKNAHLNAGSHKIFILLDAHKSLANRENESCCHSSFHFFYFSCMGEFSSECDALP